VDVIASNSKFYYIITDHGICGQKVQRFPCSGNETVLDAISQIGGLPATCCPNQIWVARATPAAESAHPKILPVDWRAITQYGNAATNYQIFPGDRIIVLSPEGSRDG
jgi:polysaccharide export outer membrane protein